MGLWLQLAALSLVRFALRPDTLRPLSCVNLSMLRQAKFTVQMHASLGYTSSSMPLVDFNS